MLTLQGVVGLMIENQIECGDYLKQLLMERDFTAKTLAQRIPCSPELVRAWIRGTRPVHPDYLDRIAEALALPASERDSLYQAHAYSSVKEHLNKRGHASSVTGMSDDTSAHWIDAATIALYHNADTRLRRAASQVRYFPDWTVGRVHIARFDVIRAVPQMERVVKLAKNDNANELVNMIYFDMADAYAIAGDLQQAEHFANCCERLSRQQLAQHGVPGAQDDVTLRRILMGIGRAIVMKQEIAYERGDDTAMLRFHEQAMPYLADAHDEYGRAKSWFFRSLFRFWQGRLDEAKHDAEEAIKFAKAITPKRDLWWAWRDGLFLGAPWWRTITQSHLLDVLVCSGETESAHFNKLFTRNYKVDPPWRKLPPFTPRYAWFIAHEHLGAARIENELLRWKADSQALGCKHLHVDIMLTYGDFLLWKGDKRAAEATYREARGKALAADFPENHFKLLADAADRRLAAPAHAFPDQTRYGHGARLYRPQTDHPM